MPKNSSEDYKTITHVRQFHIMAIFILGQGKRLLTTYTASTEGYASHLDVAIPLLEIFLQK